MSRALDDLQDAILAALKECPASEVLSIITGSFVVLTVELCRRQGHPVDKEIKINGCGNRDITIHPPKPSEEGGV